MYEQRDRHASPITAVASMHEELALMAEQQDRHASPITAVASMHEALR